ncbi:hypothetical protein [Pantoea sp. C2G6]|uniref:hypothetical protein n=1 Tax=Pantoea sp. C2G6 TaxID=3243084 RepID=UPI003ED847CE
MLFYHTKVAAAEVGFCLIKQHYLPEKTAIRAFACSFIRNLTTNQIHRLMALRGINRHFALHLTELSSNVQKDLSEVWSYSYFLRLV